MRPIRLEIEGLQSFREKQIIDFETLTEHGLFGIFGETGSGKSTILDALTLALYGNVVRIKDTQEDKLIDLLNIGSEKMMVVYEFFIGEDRYLVERVFPKKKNKKELGQSKASFVVNGQIIADKVNEVNSCIGEIIGLSMDDFTRSVVLPQGKFSEFLKLTGKEKRDMLERVFGLEEYGKKLMKKLSEEKGEKEREVAALNNIILGKGDVTPEELQGKKEEFKKLRSRKEALVEKLEVFMKEYSEKEEIYKLLTEREDLSKEKTSLLSHKEEAEYNEEKIKKGEKSAQVRDFFSKLSKCEEDIKRCQDSLQNLEKEISDKENELKNLSDAVTNLENTEMDLIEEDRGILLDPDKYEAVNNGVHKGKVLLELNSELDQLTDKISGEENRLKLLEKEEKENETNLRKVDDELEALGNEDISLLEKLGNQIVVLTGERKEVELLDGDLKFLEKKLSESKERKSALEKALLLKEEELKKAREAKEGQMAWEIAKDLKDGEPCPVCGSKDHPHVAKTAEVSAEDKHIEGIEAEKKAIEQDLYRIDLAKISSELEDKKSQLNGRNLSDIDAEIERMKKKSEEIKIKNSEIKKQKDELTELKNKFSTEKSLLAEKNKNSQNLIKNLKDSDEDKMRKKNFIKAELDKTVPEYMSDEFWMEALNESLIEMKAMERDQLRIKKELADLRSEISIKGKLEKKLKEELHVIESRSSGIKGALREKKSQADLYRVESEEKMEIFGFVSKNEVEESFLENNEMETLKEWIKEYQDKCERNRISLNNLDKKIGGRIITKSQWEGLQNGKIELENQKKDLDGKIVLLEKSIGDMEKLLEEVGNLKKELGSKKKQFDLLEDLSKLFQGNAFVEYLAVTRLRSIVANAARRLTRITNGKYSLAIDESANFLVVDNFNGGERRRSSTLSGGETFLVSLSLALALSNQIQLKGRSQLEFFFLDEGFGTLDSSLLDRVITSLETLKNQEKLKVGIITHVEDIKERVPRKLEVYAAVPGERGSKIEMV
ncbi:SMC family ATPase [uncultured Ilyobacter sp.]|uniref:SMC family ATPase n=1 Tax=uncultured Ilyobacter sp. TaxID=544433 RepID=UPI0029C75CEF|nr:SMC family ATPase [uncultured Ilyobacter sp.]